MKLLSREVEVTKSKHNAFSGSKIIRVVNLGEKPVVVEVFNHNPDGEDEGTGSVTIVPNVPEEIDKSPTEHIRTRSGTILAVAIRG